MIAADAPAGSARRRPSTSARCSAPFPPPPRVRALILPIAAPSFVRPIRTCADSKLVHLHPREASTGPVHLPGKSWDRDGRTAPSSFPAPVCAQRLLCSSHPLRTATARPPGLLMVGALAPGKDLVLTADSASVLAQAWHNTADPARVGIDACNAAPPRSAGGCPGAWRLVGKYTVGKRCL